MTKLKLTSESRIILPDGTEKPFSLLSEEEKQELFTRMEKRLSADLRPAVCRLSQSGIRSSVLT
ncbi:MAG: hypothetical protein FWG44_01035 [Oscillospiraceae bacterium]|nr:hypothetical protein [Oscillospiraceae bacterium]